MNNIDFSLVWMSNYLSHTCVLSFATQTCWTVMQGVVQQSDVRTEAGSVFQQQACIPAEAGCKRLRGVAFSLEVIHQDCRLADNCDLKFVSLTDRSVLTGQC